MANKQTVFENNNKTKPVDDVWLNMVNEEYIKLCIGTGQTPDADTSQLVKGAVILASQAYLFCVDSGTTNNYVLNPVSPLQAPPSLRNGLSIKFTTANANSGSTNINAYGFGNILAKNQDGTNLVAGDIPANTMVQFYYNGTNWILDKGAKATTTTQGIAFLPKDILISNNVGTPNSKIDFTDGVMIFDDNSGAINTSAMTGDLANLFGTSDGMLDTGTKSATSDYSLFAVYNPTTGIIKPLASLSRTAPTMPSGFTKKEYRGKILTDASGNIIAFVQRKDNIDLTGTYPFKQFSANPTTFTDINFATNYCKDVVQNINIQLQAVEAITTSFFYYRAKNTSNNGIILTSGEENASSVNCYTFFMMNVLSDSTGTWQYRSYASNSWRTDAGRGFYLTGWNDTNLKIRG